MANLEDVQNYGGKFTNQWERLQEADIPDTDCEAIPAFIRHEDESEPIN